LTGKILEQTVLELEQEEEIKNIRNAKTLYLARLIKERDDIKQLEEKENESKNNFENYKKIKRLDKYSKISTQQKLMSRAFSINYLKDLKKCTIDLLKPTFKDYKIIAFKDKYNRIIYDQIDDHIKNNSTIQNSVLEINNFILDKDKKQHSDLIANRKQMIINKKEEEERKRIQEEENKKIEKEKQIERRKHRAILRLHRNLQLSIFNQPTIKAAYHLEDISEINNMFGEGSFVGIYGGALGAILITLNIMKNHYQKNDSFFNEASIFEMLNNYVNDCSGFNLYISREVEEKIKEIIENNPDPDINNLKGMDITHDQYV
jgi:hypothetical protein